MCSQLLLLLTLNGLRDINKIWPSLSITKSRSRIGRLLTGSFAGETSIILFILILTQLMKKTAKTHPLRFTVKKRKKFGKLWDRLQQLSSTLLSCHQIFDNVKAGLLIKSSIFCYKKHYSQKIFYSINWDRQPGFFPSKLLSGHKIFDNVKTVFLIKSSIFLLQIFFLFRW